MFIFCSKQTTQGRLSKWLLGNEYSLKQQHREVLNSLVLRCSSWFSHLTRRPGVNILQPENVNHSWKSTFTRLKCNILIYILSRTPVSCLVCESCHTHRNSDFKGESGPDWLIECKGLVVAVLSRSQHFIIHCVMVIVELMCFL